MSARSMCLVSMCSVLMMLGAWLTIPFSVPFTMQTFVVYAMIVMLTPKQMTAVVVLYILLGMIGLPVFSGVQGGVGVVFGPTGGFLAGFLLMSLVRWLPCFQRSTLMSYVVVAALGTVITYVTATVWYAMLFTDLSVGGLWTAVVTCVCPFVLPDVLKAAAAYTLCRRVQKLQRG